MSQIGQYADTLQAMELDRRMESLGGGKGDNWFDEAANEEIAQQYASARDRHLAGRPARLRAAMLQMDIVCPPTTPTPKAPSMEREESAVSAQTELAIVPPKENALQVFSADKGLDPYLAKIREEIDAFIPDVKTRKGREAIASIAHKVARSKTMLDGVGKDLVAELKAIPAKIDAERKRMRDLLDSWKDEVRTPLTEWEKAEDARVDAHNDAIRYIKDLAVFAEPPSAVQVQQAIASLELVELGEGWEEFLPEAAKAKDQTLTSLRDLLTQRQAYEAEQEELARLRREAEERAEQDRIRQAQEAAVEQERQRVAQEQQAERDAAVRREQELLEQAAAQQREAENQRLQLQLQTEQAERQAAQARADQVAAEQRAEQERKDAAQREAQAAEQARLDEQRRQQAAADELVRQQQARERDEAHRRNINRAALDAFVAGGMPEACAKLAVTLIAQRKIPAIAITY